MRAVGLQRPARISSMLVGVLLLTTLVVMVPRSTAQAAYACSVMNGTTRYPALQPAVDAADPGATLIVRGRCVGNVTIDKDLNLRGKKRAKLHGGGNGSVITAGAVDLTIANITVSGGTGTTVSTLPGMCCTAETVVGGGILGDGTNLTLAGATKVLGNTAHEGAAIALFPATNGSLFNELFEQDEWGDWYANLELIPDTPSERAAAGYITGGSIAIKGKTMIKGEVIDYGDLVPNSVNTSVSIRGGSVQNLRVPAAQWRLDIPILTGSFEVTGGKHGVLKTECQCIEYPDPFWSLGQWTMTRGSAQEISPVHMEAGKATKAIGTILGGKVGTLNSGEYRGGRVTTGKGLLTVGTGMTLETYFVRNGRQLVVEPGATVKRIKSDSGHSDAMSFRIDGVVNVMDHSGDQFCPYDIGGTGRIKTFNHFAGEFQTDVLFHGDVTVNLVKDFVGGPPYTLTFTEGATYKKYKDLS